MFVLDVLFGGVFIEGVNGSEFPPGTWLSDLAQGLLLGISDPANTVD